MDVTAYISWFALWLVILAGAIATFGFPSKNWAEIDTKGVTSMPQLGNTLLETLTQCSYASPAYQRMIINGLENMTSFPVKLRCENKLAQDAVWHRLTKKHYWCASHTIQHGELAGQRYVFVWR